MVRNRPPAQAGCMRQVLRAGALGRPRGMGWRGRWEGGSGWGTHVNPWLIHVKKRKKNWSITTTKKTLERSKVVPQRMVQLNDRTSKKFQSTSPQQSQQRFKEEGCVKRDLLIRVTEYPQVFKNVTMTEPPPDWTVRKQWREAFQSPNSFSEEAS